MIYETGHPQIYDGTNYFTCQDACYSQKIELGKAKNILSDSVFNGLRAYRRQFDSNIFQLHIHKLTLTDWDNYFKGLNGQTVTYTPFRGELPYSCKIKKLYPYHRFNINFYDSVYIELETCAGPITLPSLSVDTTPGNTAPEQELNVPVLFTFNKAVDNTTIIWDIENSACNLYLYTGVTKIECNYSQLTTTEFQLIPIADLPATAEIHMVAGSTIIPADGYQGTYTGIDNSFTTKSAAPVGGDSIMFLGDFQSPPPAYNDSIMFVSETIV